MHFYLILKVVNAMIKWLDIFLCMINACISTTFDVKAVCHKKFKSFAVSVNNLIIRVLYSSIIYEADHWTLH